MGRQNCRECANTLQDKLSFKRVSHFGCCPRENLRCIVANFVKSLLIQPPAGETEMARKEGDDEFRRAKAIHDGQDDSTSGAKP